MEFREYAEAFKEVEHDFEDSVAEFGLDFEAHESTPRTLRLACAQSTGCHCENNNTSLWRNWISPACIACRTGEQTATFFVDLRCTKKCYFCFNPNQDYYDYFLHNTRDIVAELEDAYAHGVMFNCVAITGGEPLLHAQDVIAFTRRARELYPHVHIRIYTSGDLLTDDIMCQMADAGMNEVRFSVKPHDVENGQERVYGLMEKAVDIFDAVVIEVPIIPGSLDEMKQLMLRADAIGVRGINLLEFCFPLCNAEAFRSRGFKLRKHPFDILYNYWYGGGLPVAKSETESLELMQFAADHNLSMGVHYCSSDNKNTGQIYQQNLPFAVGEELRAQYPWLTQNETTHFLECAKVIGKDAADIKDTLTALGCTDVLIEDDIPAISFPLEKLNAVKNAHPQTVCALSTQVLEEGEAGLTLREVDIHRI